MSQVRVNFLNWMPDQDDANNQGLTIADNVIHEPEGYKPAHLETAGAFVTTGGLAASLATVQALVGKSFGPRGDVLCAWIAGDTLNIGVNGVTMTSSTTGYPLSFSTTGSQRAISVLDVAELDGKAFFVVEAWQRVETPAVTGEALRHSGYITY